MKLAANVVGFFVLFFFLRMDEKLDQNFNMQTFLRHVDKSASVRNVDFLDNKKMFFPLLDFRKSFGKKSGKAASVLISMIVFRSSIWLMACLRDIGSFRQGSRLG